MDGQQHWAAAHLDSNPEVKTFREYLNELTSFDHYSASIGTTPRAFCTRRRATEDHDCLVLIEPGSERVILDPLILDPTGRTSIANWWPGPESHLLAVNVETVGVPRTSLLVIDVDSGSRLGEPIVNCQPTAAKWSADGRWLVYVGTSGGGSARVLRHRIGDPAEADLELFGAGLSPVTQIELTMSPDAALLVIATAEGMSSSNRITLLRLDPDGEPAAEPTPARFGVGGWSAAWPVDRHRLYVLTDAGAPRGHLLEVDLRSEAPERTRVIVPEDPHEVLDGFAVLHGPDGSTEFLLLRSRGGAATLTLHDQHGDERQTVSLPGVGAVSELTVSTGNETAWITYSDRTTPETVLRYQAQRRQLTPWRGGLAGHRRPVTTYQETFTADDGTQVPLLITRADDLAPPLPTILQSYGAFGVAQAPEYYAAALAWAERGGQFVTAGVRGGGEYGEDWHRAGRREHKPRSIADFLDAAAHLHDHGLCTGSLGAFGYSAGGLLVAAAAMRRPEMFSAIACCAAPLDMVRYELSGLGDHWVEEFGSASDPEQLDWLLSYSPIHHVRAGVAYPATLLTGFDLDERVDPLHARKMCAALQNANSSSTPIVLRRDSASGHDLRERSARLALFADVLGFLSTHTGLSLAP